MSEVSVCLLCRQGRTVTVLVSMSEHKRRGAQLEELGELREKKELQKMLEGSKSEEILFCP